MNPGQVDHFAGQQSKAAGELARSDDIDGATIALTTCTSQVRGRASPSCHNKFLPCNLPVLFGESGKISGRNSVSGGKVITGIEARGAHLELSHPSRGETRDYRLLFLSCPYMSSRL